MPSRAGWDIVAAIVRPAQVFELRPTASRRSAIVLLVATVAFWALFAWLGAGVLTANQRVDPNLRLWALAAFGFGVYLVSKTWPHLFAKQTQNTLEFEADALSSPTPRGRTTVRYHDIAAFHVGGRSGGRHLVIATRTGGALVVPAARFADPEQLPAVITELHARIAGLPDGEARLAAIEHSLRFAQKALSKPTHLTHALLVLIAIAYVIELLMGAADDPIRLVRLGANSPLLVQDGQLYRLVTASFLHGNALHLYMNALALFSLGLVVERILGPARFLMVYAAAAVGGGLATVWAAHALFSIGSSGGVFGALGSLLIINIRYRGELPVGFAQSRRWWVIILGLNAALPLLIPQIDVAAHVGGFLAGAVLTAALIGGRDATALLVRPTPRPVVVSAIGVGLLCGFAIAVGIARGVSEDRRDEFLVLEHQIERPEMPAEELNRIAWVIVTDPEAVSEERRMAEKAAQRAVAMAPEQPEIIDTLATVHFMSGDFETAVRLERSAIARLPDDPLLLSQLARFEHAWFHRSGVEPKVVAEMVPSQGRVVVHTSSSATSGTRVDAVAVDADDEIVGYVRIDVGPGGGPTTIVESACSCEKWPAVRLEVVHTEVTDFRDDARFVATAYLDDVRKLPSP